MGPHSAVFEKNQCEADCKMEERLRGSLKGSPRVPSMEGPLSATSLTVKMARVAVAKKPHFLQGGPITTTTLSCFFKKTLPPCPDHLATDLRIWQQSPARKVSGYRAVLSPRIIGQLGLWLISKKVCFLIFMTSPWRSSALTTLWMHPPSLILYHLFVWLKVLLYSQL